MVCLVFLLSESVVILSFDIVKSIHLNHFESIVENQVYPDLINCLTEFCKNKQFMKISLNAIEIIRKCVGQTSEMVVKLQRTIASSTENINVGEASATSSAVVGNLPLLTDKHDPFVRYWYPTLFALHTIVLECDLEVRTRYIYLHNPKGHSHISLIL
jgi:brefeldin A-inhibited guanine nucleotide-exchange protein